MKKVVLCCIAIMAMSNMHAQTQADTYYRSHPVWITMMDQDAVSFTEAVKAFNLFWENKEKPLDEQELFSASQEVKNDKDFIASIRKKSEDAIQYAFEYKKFMYWQQDNQAFVKDDGYLMSKEEQLVFWKQQHEGRK